MIAQEAAPALTGRGPACPDHVLGDGRLSHRKTELEQLAMNARRTPKQVLNAHPADQRPQTSIDWRPAPQVARLPAPIAAKTSTMPAHQRLGPDDRHGFEDRRKPTIQLDEEQAIVVGELDAAAYLALQHDELMPERCILRLKSAVRLER
jgi:hypothetical protein